MINEIDFDREFDLEFYAICECGKPKCPNCSEVGK